MNLVLVFGHVGGHIDGGGSSAVIDVRLIPEEVGHSMERRSFADRQLDRRHARPELRPEFVESSFKGGIVPIELVDEHHARQLQLLGGQPIMLGAGFDAIGSTHDEHGQVDRRHGRQHVAFEVGHPGRVDQVDLVALPLDGGNRQVDGHLVGLFFVTEVRDRIAIFDPSKAGDDPGPVQQGFNQCRLT